MCSLAFIRVSTVAFCDEDTQNGVEEKKEVKLMFV